MSIEDRKINPGQLTGIDSMEFDPALESRMVQAVREHIIIPEIGRDKLPILVLLVGPCRTDTGALSTSLAQSPDVYTSHIQPIKTVRRSVLSLELTGKDIEYARKDLEITASPKVHVIKETLGIKSQAELFDPVLALLDKGYPHDKLRVVGTFKDPLVVYDSDARVYGPGYATPTHINTHFEMTWKAISNARKHNIPSYIYLGESYLRDNDPHSSMETLLGTLDIAYHSGVVDWDNGHGYDKDVTHYEIPPQRFISGSVSRQKGGRGGLKWVDHTFVLPPEELDQARFELGHSYTIYNMAKLQADYFLGIDNRKEL